MPPRRVLAAFGVGERSPERLPGGRGLAWRAGDLVLRPHGDLEEARWRSDVLTRLPQSPAFRTPRPIPTLDGEWTSDGWEAWQWLPGAADESRVVDVIEAGTEFHAVVASLGRPAFLDRSEDAWSRADRAVWGEGALPHGRLLDRLAAAFAPVAAPSQVIHGDLLGNVLFAPGAPPAIIDWAPYWRPAALGAAIAAVDAACWHGWPVSRLEELGAGDRDWRQLLVRALAFRIATLHLLGAWTPAMDARHEPAVLALERGRPR